MSAWTEPSPSDFDRWEKLIEDGADPSEAGRQLGFRGSSAFRRANPHRHAETIEWWRDIRDGQDRTLARDTFREIAGSHEASESARVQAAAQLAKTSGMLADRVEVTGAHGGAVEVTSAAVTEAVERFTAGLVPLAARTGTADAPREPDRRGES